MDAFLAIFDHGYRDDGSIGAEQARFCQPELFLRCGIERLALNFRPRIGTLTRLARFMTRLVKTLAVFGIWLCISLGAFAVSFAAHDSPPGHFLAIELNRSLAADLVQLGRYRIRFGLEAETAAVPTAAQSHLGGARAAGTRIAEPMHPGTGTRFQTPKVSLQILELVLLL
jgi:hypothetical protein